MDLALIEAEFGIPGVLAFDEPHPGMVRAKVTTAACAAELYLHGAHLTAWQPAGEQPVLFLSESSEFVPGKAIRGGVPVIAPWFGNPRESPVFGGRPPEGAPSHGWARTSVWTLRFAAQVGEEVRLSLTLEPTSAEVARFGCAGLKLAYEVVLGRRLTLRLTAANSGPEELRFEEALHSYFAVGDVEAVAIHGLQGTDFLDKTEGFRRKSQEESVLRLTGETDRPYLNTDSTVVIEDPVLERRVVIEKFGSRTTVVWNPFPELAVTLKDLAPGSWRRFTCVETANVAGNTVELAPGGVHGMEARVSVERLDSRSGAASLAK